MKSCMTCRWVACHNYGKNIDSCEKYIMSLEEERRLFIEKRANEDHLSKDDEYNMGLHAIRKYGYLSVCGNPEVKYYCMCNNI